MADNISLRVDRPDNQIVVTQNAYATLAFYDTLVPAHEYRYAQIHAKGEYESNGWRENSKIRITLTNKKEDQTTHQTTSMTARDSIEPERLQFLLTRLTAGFQDVEFTDGPKIYGSPDRDGLCQVSSMKITRHGFDQNGNPMKSPWHIEISNGRGIKQSTKTGGTKMASGSFRQEAFASMNLSDEVMFTVLKRVDSYINAWETVTAQDLIAKGKKAMDNYKASNGNNYARANSAGQSWPTPGYTADQPYDTGQYQNTSGNGFTQYAPYSGAV